MPRIIYSLQLDLYPRRPGELLELIAPLDANGQSPHCRALPPKSRMIDLRPGDHVHHKTGRYRIKSVKAYRDATIRAEAAPHVADGYVVRGSV